MNEERREVIEARENTEASLVNIEDKTELLLDLLLLLFTLLLNV